MALTTNKVLIVVGIIAIVPTLQADKSVTYPGIGTFHSHDFHDATHRPFTDLFMPQSPQHVQPEFLLFTRKNLHDQEKLHWNDTENIKGSKFFNGTLLTKVIVHGFLDNQALGHWMKDMKDRFLEIEDYNVIIVDWSKGNALPYGQATVNTRVVGAMVAIQIQALCELKHSTPDKFHILGHSLGSHVAGYAGKFMKGALGHITGLDPAGPYFEGIVPEGRLWHTDAKFVEAIHTDARPLTNHLGFGMYETCAHVDIYPNGGKVQPGCDQERLTTIVLHGIVDGARALVACNHQRAVDFYLDALAHLKTELPKAYECASYDEFKAGKCTDCGPNGEKCVLLGPKTIEHQLAGHELANGKRFFMVTDSDSPYLKFQYLIKIKMASKGHNHHDEHGKIFLKFNDIHGNSESLDFGDGKDHKYHLEQTYYELLVLKTDPTELASLDFEWSHTLLDIIHTKLYVESVEVVGLSSITSSTKSAPIVFKYCNHAKDQGITNGQHVFLDKC